jgi:L-aminopeptidase/D-esterase-like protein
MTADGALTDVPGIRVGHATALRRGWRTGTTVVLLADGEGVGATGGVDVRGGGPGTRETDLLRPENLVHHVHAICLTGGSAYGLAAADGVMLELERRGIGFPVATATSPGVVPIVPTAVVYDLGRGGVFGNRPDASFGARAVRAARRAVVEGAVGAGTGTVSGTLQGGVGTASTTLADGTVVGALAVVNSVGSVIDPATGLPWEPTTHLLRRPARTERAALADRLQAAQTPLNTTIGVVATSTGLSKSECTKFAGVAHDGMARAVRPVHTMFDGDTVFGLATGGAPAAPNDAEQARTRAARVNAILEAGAHCFAIACTRAVLEARSVPGGPPAYRDLCPSAFGR